MNWKSGLHPIFAIATVTWFGVVFLWWPYKSTQLWISIAEAAGASPHVRGVANAGAEAPISNQVA